jgi:hypothetical protein
VGSPAKSSKDGPAITIYFFSMVPDRDDTRSLEAAILRDGYAFVEGPAIREMLGAIGSLADWDDFAASWDALEVDGYLAGRGQYRRRRHAAYAVGSDGPIVRKPHQPHYQSLDYNHLQGGIERWFEPVQPAVGEGASMLAILGFCRALFGALAPSVASWHVEAHQFRIEARPGEAGQPTPEGSHRDGVDFVLVLLVRRQNIVSGTTTIHDLQRRTLGSFTLTHPCDAALVDDARVYHGVTPVEPLDPSREAYRDVLVVTFRKEQAAGG